MNPRVYMIRHGRPSSTWADAGDPDPGLSPQGLDQAAAAAATLMALPAALRPARVISSPLRRCRETAEPFALALGVEVAIDPRVGEIPTPRGLGPGDRPAWLKAAFALRWAQIRGDRDYDLWRREVARAVAEAAGAAVFSHYVALNAAVSCALGDDRVEGFRPDHASVTTFEVAHDGLRLVERGREAATEIL